MSGDRLRRVVLQRPSHAERELVIFWGVNGEPTGLVVDDRSYRVTPARRLKPPPGSAQWLFKLEPPESSPDPEGRPVA